MTNFEQIEKEAVAELKFPKQEVLNEKTEQQQRQSELERALSLGNLEHLKMKIYFEDDLSKKMVETTIWGTTDQSIILKKGLVIPVNRIYKLI